MNRVSKASRAAFLAAFLILAAGFLPGQALPPEVLVDSGFSGLVTINGTVAPDGTVVVYQNLDGVEVGRTTTETTSAGPGYYGLAESDFTIYYTLSDGQRVNASVPAYPDFGHLEVEFRRGFDVVVDLHITTSESNPVEPLEDGEALITVPRSVTISSTGEATDSTGSGASVVGGTIQLTREGEAISLPVAVPSGRSLDSLDASSSGVTVTRLEDRMRVRIAIRDLEGNDTIRIIAETTELAGTGLSVSGTVLSMSIDLPTRTLDVSEDDPRVGTASVKVLGEVTAFPTDSSMRMTITKSTDDESLETVAALALEDGFEPFDTAYAVGFVKQNLDPVLGEITLRLQVGKSWLEDVGTENVKVYRLADDGTVQVFDWVAVDPEADPLQFNLVSPNGLSKFIIEALKKIPEPTPIPTPTAVPTATPTLTPVPTATPSPIPSTATPVSRPTVSPTVAPGPTATPTVAAVMPVPTPPPVRPTVATVSTPTPVPTPAPAVTLTDVPPTLAAAPTVAPASSGDGCNSSGGAASPGMIGLITMPLGLLLIRRGGVIVAGRPG